MDLDFGSPPSLIGSYMAAAHFLAIGTALLAPLLCRKWGLVTVATDRKNKRVRVWRGLGRVGGFGSGFARGFALDT